MTMNLASLVRDYYQHIDTGNVESALACFASDAVYRRPGYPPLTGLGAIEDYYRNTRVIGTGQHHIEMLVGEGDEIAIRGSFHGVSRDDLPLAIRFADFWRFVEGAVVERNTYFDAAAV